jgi:hypothetical protein
MKFLCIECDEAMKISETRGPDEGSMTVIFGCPKCGKGVAMLTNPMETQMVRALDVKIGGGAAAAGPMSVIKNSLASKHDGMPVQQAGAEDVESGGEGRSGSKCPFTGTIADAFEKKEKGIIWTSDAEARLARIPFYVRSMVQKSIEQHAREQGYKEINVTVMDKIKEQLGM